MYEVTNFIKKNHTFFLSTMSADQPELRPIGVFEEYDGRIYTAVGQHKKVFRQITSNPLIVITACEGATWIRLRGTAVVAPNEIVEKVFADNPFLKSIYNDESKLSLGVIEIANATVEYCGMMGPDRTEALPGTERYVLPRAKLYEGLSQHRPPLCFELVGKTFELVMDDGYDYELKFIDRKKISYGVVGCEKAEYNYECLKADDITYFVNFEMTGATPRSGMSFVLDMEQSLTTRIIASEGLNPKLPKLPSTEFEFGAIRKVDGTVPEIRHGYTTEMEGKAIQWRYGRSSVVHVYSSERYYRLTLPKAALEKIKEESPERYASMSGENGKFFEEPSSYVKIKEGMYLFSFVEDYMARQGRTGCTLCFLMNWDRMYDVGRSFGYNGNNERENYTFGAYGEFVDPEPMLSRKSFAYIR